MSVYTKLHFIPADAGWRPSIGFLEDLARFVGAANVAALSFYATPRIWDGPPRTEIESFRDLAVLQAIQLLAHKDGVGVTFLLDCDGWKERLVDSLERIPEKISDGYVPWDLSLHIGRLTLPDQRLKSTVATASFEVGIGGNWSPSDPDAYLQSVLIDRQVINLLEFLIARSGQPWRVLMTTT